MLKRILKAAAALVLVVVVVAGIAVIAMGPAVAWELLRHGPTTVWDHLEYPTRALDPSPDPIPWRVSETTDLAVLDDGSAIIQALEEGDSLAFLVIHDGMIVGEWYRGDHGPDVPTMLFSASKSLLSLLIGVAVDDGLIASVSDPVTAYVPELTVGGFEEVTLEDLLTMDSSMDYVEDDNPFGIHIPFNFTRDLRAEILDLEVREQPDASFRYKSGDNALLGLVLERALDGVTLTDYMEQRLWDPLGAEYSGSWNVDDEDGFERTWCCLAMTARDLARYGQLVLQDGVREGQQLISGDWLDASFEPRFTAVEWPAGLSGSALANYGYQWWLLGDGTPHALGKAGQYLYVDRQNDVVIVRLGEEQGDVSWAGLMQKLAGSL